MAEGCAKDQGTQEHSQNVSSEDLNSAVESGGDVGAGAQEGASESGRTNDNGPVESELCRSSGELNAVCNGSVLSVCYQGVEKSMNCPSGTICSSDEAQCLCDNQADGVCMGNEDFYCDEDPDCTFFECLDLGCRDAMVSMLRNDYATFRM